MRSIFRFPGDSSTADIHEIILDRTEQQINKCKPVHWRHCLAKCGPVTSGIKIIGGACSKMFQILPQDLLHLDLQGVESKHMHFKQFPQ